MFYLDLEHMQLTVMVYSLLQEGDAVNYVGGSQAVMPYNAGFMGNPMISTGNVSMK